MRQLGITMRTVVTFIKCGKIQTLLKWKKIGFKKKGIY